METTETNVSEIIDKMKNLSKEDISLIKKAYDFSKKAHEGQKRYSGEPYFTHVFQTGKNLAEIGMCPPVVAAGLLHDTVEDTEVTDEDIKREFGDEILMLVEGVTKLGTIRYRGLKRHIESLRKFFIASANDMRVLVIKLVDRLHNMETLEHVPKEKQLRIAQETLEVYAPLAYRLGMRVLNNKLEDLAFKFVYPKEYSEITKILKQRSKEDIKYLEKVDRSLKKILAREGMRDVRTMYRVKGIYSLFRKLERKDKDINKIYDISALRIITKNIPDCYRVLGLIHSTWRPLPGRIKDFIAVPKPNGYKSIHTTIFTGNGGIVEIQIRTEDMHQEAEYGIASHIFYKSSKDQSEQAQSNRYWFERLVPGIMKNRKNQDEDFKKIANEKAPLWIKKMMDYSSVSESQEFLDDIREDLFQQRVFVFTPIGDVIDLPVESTPIDLAYSIHSDIGNHISGAKVNGKLMSLDTKLKNGDIVEIETKKTSKPTKKWLDYAKTTDAKRHIKAFLAENNVS